MKALTLNNLIASLFIVSASITDAQTTTEGKFDIVQPLKKSTYNGQALNKMKYKELKTILLSTGDEQIATNLRTIQAKRAVSTTLIVCGSVMSVAGAVMNIGTKTTYGPYGGSVTSATNTGAGLGVQLGGVGVMLVGSLVGIGNKKLVKRSMERYNELGPVTTPQLSLGSTSLNGTNYTTLSLAWNF